MLRNSSNGIPPLPTSIFFVFQVCAFLPLLGMLTWFLPDLEQKR